jgi:pimeloyl-ACP methyl ester carboxylesterase
MAHVPALVFVPGSWHKPACYDKVIHLLESEHGITCVPITLPSTQGDPKATFKDDVDAVQAGILSQTKQGRDVIVVAHSYGGLVGASSIRGFAREEPDSNHGLVKAFILIASGFSIAGLSFLDPALGMDLPFFKSNKETGFAELSVSPSKFFYHDLSPYEAQYWVGQLTPQSLKALAEDGQYVYEGWKDVPTWYIGTVEDQGLPVMAQRMLVGMARGQGAVVHHEELQTSHSPFLSQPDEVVRIMMDTVREVGGKAQAEANGRAPADKSESERLVPAFRLFAPLTWIKYGLPLSVGHVIGWAMNAFVAARRLWR